ncbi:ATP-binding protein, partial [Glutamicibacter sp. BSL13]
MSDEEPRRLHTAVLVGSENVPRRDRKARQKAAAKRLAADAAERKAIARDQARAERAEAKATRYLPASGEDGPAALRTPV